MKGERLRRTVEKAMRKRERDGKDEMRTLSGQAWPGSKVSLVCCSSSFCLSAPLILSLSTACCLSVFYIFSGMTAWHSVLPSYGFSPLFFPSAPLRFPLSFSPVLITIHFSPPLSFPTHSHPNHRSTLFHVFFICFPFHVLIVPLS